MNTHFLQGDGSLLTWCYINRVHFVIGNVLLKTVQASLKVDAM